MTVTSANASDVLNGNGSTRIFAWTFKAWDTDQMAVFFNDGTTEVEITDPASGYVENTDYTITILDADAGTGEVEFPLVGTGDPLTSSQVLAIYRDETFLQDFYDVQNNQDFLAETLEESVDRVVTMVQQNKRDVDRSVKIAPTDDTDPEDYLEDTQAAAAEAAASEAAAAASETAAAASEAAAAAYVDALHRVETLLELTAITSQSDGDTAYMNSFYAASAEEYFLGGGRFVWQATINKNLANGGTIVDPVTLGGFDGTSTTRDAYLTAQGTGVGSGCWVRTDYVYPDIAMWGAVDDGVVDNLAVFNLIEALGESPIMVTGGDYAVSAQPTQAGDVAYLVDSTASVTVPASNWNTARNTYDTPVRNTRRVNITATNPTIPVEDYTIITDAQAEHFKWINQWGYQEPNTSGRLVGSNPSSGIPGGQSRLARSGCYAMEFDGSHSGEGDGYNLVMNMGVSQHSRISIVDERAGQNSGGMFGGQVNALTDKVNLYAGGDLVLHDQGQEDVSMLGLVTILYNNGTDSGDYYVARANNYAVSNGSNDIDFAYGLAGKFKVGIDLSSGDFSEGAITLLTGDKIYFDATAATTTGKFGPEAVGGYSFGKHSTGDYLETIVDTQNMLQTYDDRLQVKPATQTVGAFRVYGTGSATAYAGVGQIGTSMYLTAAGTAENTQIRFQTSASGTEAEHLRIDSAGNIYMYTIPTYADNAAAVSGGLATDGVYKTATGELRIVI